MNKEKYLALVILPDNTELNDAFWDGGDFERLAIFGMFLKERGVFEG
jgi:hypothetical protein